MSLEIQVYQLIDPDGVPINGIVGIGYDAFVTMCSDVVVMMKKLNELTGSNHEMYVNIIPAITLLQPTDEEIN